ncbi:HAD-IIIC family phosphatase [Paenibacillus lautus]|uniref:HAD-IIIC family phosphatase n=1 Tax=Paenibacillus lautus TaxID=1401 RepID=UPI001C7D1C8C|nr:HAD-IIIC family phosphatase [Paenibacillus lautus]MBX4147494.1 HAD-IIIC family phosphatase [Paenibacillus lautus]
MLNIFDNKNIFIIGGCEFDYIRNHIRKNSSAKIEHTFELKTSMDPYSELNNPDSLFFQKDFDYIFLSQVQLYKNIFVAINNNNQNVNLHEEIDILMGQLASSIEKINQNKRVPIFVMTHPIIDLNANGITSYKYSYSVTEINYLISYKIYNLCKNFENLYISDLDSIVARTGKSEENIRYEFNGGHPEKKSAMLISEEIATIAKSISTKETKIKCVVVDLDNTLWKGVLREDGIEKIKLYKQRIFALQHMAKKGIVLAICSKNDAEDLALIKEVLSKYSSFYDSVVLYKINWSPKSENIKQIAQELNIGIDSVAFFDDNEFETNEVKTNSPSVKVYKDNEIIGALSYPEFQPLGEVTKEAKNRINFYKAEIQRNESKQISDIESKSHEDYLRGLDLNLVIRNADINDLQRMEEVFQRTNQQNVTLKRVDLAKLQEFLDDNNVSLLCLELKDKFGDYGMIGSAIVKKHYRRMEIEEFALSCRAMGRKVEQTFLLFLINEGIRNKCKGINIKVTKTSRNNQLISMLKEAGFIDSNTSKETSEMDFNISSKSKPFVYPEWFGISTCDIEFNEDLKSRSLLDMFKQTISK